jgi:hypothetical protein
MESRASGFAVPAAYAFGCTTWHGGRGTCGLNYGRPPLALEKLSDRVTAGYEVTDRPCLKATSIDEVGYLSYSNRHADLLFELISRRYDAASIVVKAGPIPTWAMTALKNTCAL